MDDLTWRFKLRDGVKFQDGADFNADAVVHKVNRLMNRNLTCDSRSKFGGIKLTPKTVDAYTVEIKSAIPIPILPTLMGTVQTVFAKVHDDVIADVPMSHMIGYTRVGKRIEGWRPTLKTNSEIRMSEINLKD